MNWSTNFMNALVNPEPYDYGQPVYLRPIRGYIPDYRPYVVMECEQDFSGNWLIKCVLASNPAGQGICARESDLAPEWPHKEVYIGTGLTRTGIELVAVTGGMK